MKGWRGVPGDDLRTQGWKFQGMICVHREGKERGR